ncbi:MAG: glycerate kinase [Pseudomonadota bacterium]
MSEHTQSESANSPFRPDDPMRELLYDMYQAAVSTAHPSVCVPPHLPDIPENGRLLIIGAGKAAAAMAVATEQYYSEKPGFERVSGFVTTRHGYALPTQRIEILEAGHPVPDSGSVDGAKRAAEFISSATENDIVLCLISGGASALWSAPVDGVTFEAKQALTKALLRSGARISEMNCVRKHLSRIKGGRLAALAAPAKLITLSISDVPGDSPDAIGSGPTVADATTLADARAVLGRYGVEAPPEITEALANPQNETPKASDPAFANTNYRIVAAPKASIEAAAKIAKQNGYRVEILGDALEGEAREVAAEHAKRALEAKVKGDKLAILSGGELTVTVRGDGSGGPNQEYALGLAIALDGANGIVGVAGDTDGSDGGSGASDDPAGAFVFEDTLTRATSADLNAATFLENNDSTAFFKTIGDLILCGPTQTNVNDLRVVLVTPAQAE